ncbi:hypothetical protein H9P43_002653 [Blastocladiella emersonii ATCC 22665]|nr:hypothetical protein H9P43_002653 [Blastocladiella emersonii ATCC 22665]
MHHLINSRHPTYYITKYVAKHAKKLRECELNSAVPLPLLVGSILPGLVHCSKTSREISGQYIALDLIRKGEETWVYTTYSSAHVSLYQFLCTDAQRVGENGAAAVDDERELEQEDDENNDEHITFSKRPVTNKITIADHYMYQPSELESLSLYDFVRCCRMEPIKSATNRLKQSVPDNDAGNGNAPRAKRGRHAEPRYKFRDTRAAVGKLIRAMRAAKVVPVPLFNKKVGQSSDFDSTKSRAMISMILFKPFRVITEVVAARGET